MPRVTGTSTGDVLTLAVAGSLRGDAAARQVEAAAARLVRSRHREVRVSLADVPALDAAGIGRLVILARALAARGLRMRLVDVPPRLGRILEAVHLRHLLCGREEAERISQSREEAATPAASSTVGAWV